MKNDDTYVSVQEARKVLGKQAINLTDEEIMSVVAEFKHLAEGWIDLYERKIFKGKTVNELLNKLEESNL